MSKDSKKLLKEFFNQKAKLWDKNIKKEEIKNLKRIISYIRLKKYERVLDVGCGTAIAYPYLSKKFKTYVGIDISQEMIKIARKKFPNAFFINDDFEKYDFKEKFDLVFIFNTFPHLENQKLSLLKTRRILNKDGKIIIAHSLPLKKVNQIHKKINNPLVSRQRVSVKSIKGLLKKANFKRIKIISKNFFYAEGLY